MSEISTIFIQSELALAAYADLIIGEPSISNLVQAGMTQAQAEAFASNWRVIDQYSDSTGLSVAVFEEVDTSNRYLAIRGTDDADDIITDFIDIAVLGTPERQDQYAALSTQVQAWLLDGTLSTGFSVTGHSLGGFLAGSLLVDYAVEVDHAYLYNSPGVGGLSAGLRLLLGLESEPTLDLSKVSNLIAQAGPSFTAGLGLDWGTPVGIAIEDQSPNLFANHSIRHLTDALAVYNLFATIDPSLSVETITYILQAMPVDNENLLEAAVAAVGGVYGKTYPAIETDRNSLYVNLYDLQASLPGQATIGSLTETSATSLESQASNPAYLYALLNLNPFAIIGADYSHLNVDGYLEKGTYSEQFIEDRAAFLYYSVPGHDNPDSIRYEQRGENGADDFVIPGNGQSIASNYIFGTKEGDGITGDVNEDHLYGMGGDDVEEGNWRKVA